MLQNPRKTLGFKKNMVYKIPPGGGGKPYPASGLYDIFSMFSAKCKENDTAMFFITSPVANSK